jgi:TDG/mug DNA glycosylase family protein
LPSIAPTFEVVSAMHVEGFPPLARADARILILGSMPGIASVKLNQYYGHPRNAFWRILGEVAGFDPAAPYEARIQLIQNAQLAVWDVLARCIRKGSLDSAIEQQGIIPNGFPNFFDTHAGIKRVCFNGAHSATLFRRYVLPSLDNPDKYEWRTLPSTSPAHAAMSFENKLAIWRAAL